MHVHSVLNFRYLATSSNNNTHTIDATIFVAALRHASQTSKDSPRTAPPNCSLRSVSFCVCWSKRAAYKATLVDNYPKNVGWQASGPDKLLGMQLLSPSYEPIYFGKNCLDQTCWPLRFVLLSRTLKGRTPDSAVLRLTSLVVGGGWTTRTPDAC